MNELDKELLELLEKIISSEGYEYNKIPKKIITHIKRKYQRTSKLFDRHESESYNTDDSIFLINKEKLILTKKGKNSKKIFDSDSSINSEDYLFLKDYTNESKFITGFGKAGHDIYDYLKQQRLSELTQETITKQTKIIENQQNSLNNTFWVYFLIAFVMGFDLLLRFLGSRLKITLFTNIIYALLLVILTYIYFTIGGQFSGLKLKRKKVRVLVICIFVFIVLIVAVIFSGYIVPEQIVWKDETLSDKQKEFFEKQMEGTTPQKPKIEIKLNHPDGKKFAVWDIADIKIDDEGNQFFEKQKIRFVISNIGKMSAGTINAYLESNFTNHAQAYLKELSGEKSEFLEFEIWYNNCQRDLEEQTLQDGTKVEKSVVNSECDYNLGKIPLGWQKFNLTIKCNLCDENKSKQVYPFSFCIFKSNYESKDLCD